MINYKEFRIGDLFDIHPTKSYGLTNDKLFKKEGTIPVVVNSSLNNGIGGYVDLEPTEKGNIITYSDTTTSDGIFYQPHAFIGYSHVQGLYPIKYVNRWNEKTLLYFVTLFRKQAKGKFNYGNKFTRKIAADMIVKLPINSNNEIDFDYMERYIESLQSEPINKLDNYLNTSGLNNYVLSNQDLSILNEKVNKKEFKLDELFESSTGDVDLQQKDINGKGYYFINSGVQNYGIKGKTDREARIFKSNTITIDFWGNAYYRSFDYKLATHNHVFSLTGDVIKNEKVGLYLVSQMRYFRHLFSYNEMGTWNKMKKLSIFLPIDSNGEINYKYMEDYIDVQQKIAIADVVKWKDKLINKINENSI